MAVLTGGAILTFLLKKLKKSLGFSSPKKAGTQEMEKKYGV